MRRRATRLFFSEEGRVLMTTVPRRHRFTVEEYYQVADRGLVHVQPPSELVAGGVPVEVGSLFP